MTVPRVCAACLRAAYLCVQTRLIALNRAELETLQHAIAARISQLLLFTLFVECDGCADVDGLGPLPVRAHEGDNVEDLTNEAARLAGREDDEEWVARVRGAVIVTFHNYKIQRYGNAYFWAPSVTKNYRFIQTGSGLT